MIARLLSVNVGLPREINWRGQTVRTAVWKNPVQGKRMVRRLNIEGDGQGDLAGHGGEHRAVFVYQIDSYRIGRTNSTAQTSPLDSSERTSPLRVCPIRRFASATSPRRRYQGHQLGNPPPENATKFKKHGGKKMKILMVLTSHDQLGNTGRKTGFWLEEFAAPYFVFRDAGVELTLASPKGGQPPLDPKSDEPKNQTPAMTRFKKDAAAQKALANTVKLADVKAEDFDTVFYPGGHGPMWDLAESPASIALLEAFYNSGKPIALVCHSPGVLRHVTYQGAPLVKGKHVTGFTNGEEEEMQLTKVVPFLVEDELLRLGAIFEKKANWQPFPITDGRLITGQNPASSTSDGSGASEAHDCIEIGVVNEQRTNRTEEL